MAAQAQIDGGPCTAELDGEVVRSGDGQRSAPRTPSSPRRFWQRSWVEPCLCTRWAGCTERTSSEFGRSGTPGSPTLRRLSSQKRNPLCDASVARVLPANPSPSVSGFPPTGHWGLMVTDKDLLQRSLAGDTVAFGALVERHEAAVCAVSFAVTGDREVSEDVTQDAFLTAWRSLPTLREPARFKAWACGIARNLARKARATRSRLVEAAREPADPLPGADEMLDARSREAAVWASLESLSPTYREPLVLFYREGRSTREVAEALGLSIATVEQRLSRGRKQLRAEVMDLVERTLEDGPPPGRISSAVVATIGVNAIPVGGDATTSSGPAPGSNSTTMKTILIASALATTAGLTAYAASSSTGGTSPSAPSETGLATTTAGHEPARDTKSAKQRPTTKTSASLGSDLLRKNTTQGAALELIDKPFELTNLGPSNVVVDVRGGRSEATGSSKDLPIIGHIEGVVRTEKGKPIANAVVLGGRTLTMKFGKNIGAQAGVLSDERGRFVLPVFQPANIGVLAAHNEHGMSAVVSASTQSEEVELRLVPFSWIEGTVTEGAEGIPARVALLGSKAPLLVFSGPTQEDGTYRLGPLPPGPYTIAASTSHSDAGSITRFPEFHVRLRPRHSTHRDIQASDGPMLVLESTLPETLAIEWVRLGIFTGPRDIESLEAFADLARTSSSEDYQGITRSGIDSHSGDASFTGLAPGTYTGCVGVRLKDDEGRIECKTVELSEDDLKVINFGPR